MKSSRSLAPLIAHVLAAVAPLATGCGADDPTSMPETAPCASTFATRYSALTLGPDVAEGVQFFSSVTFGQPGTIVGTPCAGATDKDACAKRVEALALETRDQLVGWTVDFDTEFAIATRGDDVRRLVTADEVRPLVVPIDGLAEAAAWATLNGTRISCNGPNARTQADGIVVQYVSGNCGHPVRETLTLVRPDGTISLVAEHDLGGEDSNCVEGRRPAGYVAKARPWLTTAAAHVAEIASMEAASVTAFAELERELALHRAPEALLARIGRARRDEIAHAAIMGAEARRLGARPLPYLHAVPRGARSLLALAIENVVEGCVRESYGAVVAAWQAEHAADAHLRAAFRRVAADEAEHAALSLDIASWIAAKLSRDERAIVALAERAAVQALFGECRQLAPTSAVVRECGMPTPNVATALLANLRAHLPRAA